MRESLFIDKNKEKWQEFSQMSGVKEKDPGKLSRLFIQITDDLSYARTFYPNRYVRHYLNGLAENIFMQINRSRKQRFADFLQFWKTTLPLMNYQARPEFLVSFMIFAMAFVIGMVSTRADIGFASPILGDEYIAMTLDNIEKGEPMGVYKNFLPFEGFLQITLNNLLVAAWTFVFGIFSALGTVFILLYNGVMIGSFQQFFIDHGFFRMSFLTIWQHGAIEVSCIVIAGAAGLTMGKGLLFPGTYTRAQSFRMAAHRGFRIFLGIVPPIIIAAFIEGFLTRFTGLPDFLRAFTIVASLTAMFAYYIWYPAKLAKTPDVEFPKPRKVESVNFPELELRGIYTDGRLFENTLLMITGKFKRYFWPLLALAALKTFAIIIYLQGAIEYTAFFFGESASAGWPVYFNYNEFPFFYLLNGLVMIALLYIFMKPLIEVQRHSGIRKQHQSIKFGFIIIFMGLLSNTLFFIGFWWAYLILIFVFPFMVLIGFAYLDQDIFLFRAADEGYRLYFDNFLKAIGLTFRFGLIKLVILYLSFRLIFYIATWLLVLFNLPPDLQNHAMSFIVGTIFFLILYMGSGMIITAMGMLYYSANEAITAQALLDRIEQFGSAGKILGYEKE